MVEVNSVTAADEEFWLSIDTQLSKEGFEQKVKDGQGYVLSYAGHPLGFLRYNFLKDCIPLCSTVYVDKEFRGHSYGRFIMEVWENNMEELGYERVMVSTPVDSNAQHFFRRLGYKDCGGLLLDTTVLELFMIKTLATT